MKVIRTSVIPKDRRIKISFHRRIAVVEVRLEQRGFVAGVEKG